MFNWSKHALERWGQRFAGIDKDTELSSGKRIGIKIRRKIKILTPVNAERYMHGFNGRYFLIGRSNVIFVVENDTVITVFHLYGPEKT